MKTLIGSIAIVFALVNGASVVFAAAPSGAVAADTEPSSTGTAAGDARADRLQDRNSNARKATAPTQKAPGAAAAPAATDFTNERKEHVKKTSTATTSKPTPTDAANKKKNNKLSERNQQARQKSGAPATHETPAAQPAPASMK